MRSRTGAEFAVDPSGFVTTTADFSISAGAADRAIVVESSPWACADTRVNVPAGRVVESPFERWRPEAVDLVVITQLIDVDRLEALRQRCAERRVSLERLHFALDQLVAAS